MAVRKRKPVDTVRASRDGHEFHETWTARKAMQLLQPRSDLTAIAVEGLSPLDQAGASPEVVEVADITIYFGGGTSFDTASQTIFAQFKYSIAGIDRDFRAVDAKKTVEKFGKTFRDFKKKYGSKSVQEGLDFQLITNQKISENLLIALDSLIANSPRTGDVKKQAEQFQRAAGLSGRPLADFTRKFKLLGRTGSLPELKKELASLLVDLSASDDPMARARLGELKSLVRDKAGYAGSDRNLIKRTDVLAALQIGDPEDLLPSETRISKIGEVIEREQIDDALTHISTMTAPLLIQATGGVGKTVFLDTLARRMDSDHEVVLFDCFGGGAYRSPADARHLPKRGLVHIANVLAFRGLCDPMLPSSSDIQGLLRTFRRRLRQCLRTIESLAPGRNLVIIIDAIDNAEIAASRDREDCFPIKLLESLDTEPIQGVKIVASCRPERRPETYAKYEELQLHPFSKGETKTFLQKRIGTPTQVEANVAWARSRGNPRVLENLIEAGRGLLDPSEIGEVVKVDDLIRQRISDALAVVKERGYKEAEIGTFLAGLAVLPPPVPLAEYANACGIEPNAIESFVSDLTPLLDRTSEGVIFRDEPTESIVREQYASSKEALRRLASNLSARQQGSVYAARALPDLLYQIGDGEALVKLAFDDRVPSEM